MVVSESVGVRLMSLSLKAKRLVILLSTSHQFEHIFQCTRFLLPSIHSAPPSFTLGRELFNMICNNAERTAKSHHLPHHCYRLQMDCHWAALSTRYLSHVIISLLPDGLFLLTVVITGGRYIIYAGGWLTKVSGMYCITVSLADSRPIFEINQIKIPES